MICIASIFVWFCLGLLICLPTAAILVAIADEIVRILTPPQRPPRMYPSPPLGQRIVHFLYWTAVSVTAIILVAGGFR